MSVKGASWLLGIILIIVMFAGARWILGPGSATTSSRNPSSSDKDEPLNMVISWGHFDVEPGVNRALFPKQPGTVDMVVAENTPVKKDQVLLQVDDRMAQLKVKEADIAVQHADAVYKEALKLPELYKLQKAQQQAAINAVQKEIDELKAERESRLKSLNEKDPIYKSVVERFDFGLSKLDEKKKAEQARLGQIGLQDADLKIAQADADVKAKKVQVEQAKEALTYFQVKAPSDGLVLRVNVKRGEVLGTSPQMPALEFLPDLPIIVRAEVLQEWGRYVKVGQDVEIEDDVYHGPKWDGTVKSLSKWYAPTRSPVIEPFRYNDVRTMECIIQLKDAKDARIGQRVRAKIKIK